MINNKDNNIDFNCKKIEFLYNNCHNESIEKGEFMKCFFQLDSDSIIEMLRLRASHQINDRLMPFFIMSYKTEIGIEISKKIGSDTLNNFLAESWFSYFQDNNDMKNDFFLLVPIYTTDLMNRITSILPSKEMVKTFYLDVLFYTEHFISMINDGSFYFIFDEKRKSTLGVALAEEFYFSDFVKNSVESFYFSCLYLFFKEVKTGELTKKDIFKRIQTYHEVVDVKNFYNSKLFNKVKNKNSNDGENKENTEIDDDTITLSELFLKAKSLIASKKRVKKENGAYECNDGSFRKPTQGKKLIISKKNSSNAFTLVFITLTVFTLLGVFVLSYANKNESSYTPIKESQISNDLSSIVQDNLHLKTLK